jgi:hypothetical protein
MYFRVNLKRVADQREKTYTTKNALNENFDHTLLLKK